MIITRKVLNLQEYITIEHIESKNKVIVATGMIVGVAYLTELFISWYSGYIYEQFAFFNRALGPYYWSYFGMMLCNVISPLLFFKKSLRRNITFTFFMSIFINIGMWFERFVIIATTLARDYLPSSWSFYVPTWVEIGIYLGTMGLFFTLYLIFVRVAPVVAIAEVKSILKTSGDQYVGPNAIHHDDHDHEEEHDHHVHAHHTDDHGNSNIDNTGNLGSSMIAPLVAPESSVQEEVIAPESPVREELGSQLKQDASTTADITAEDDLKKIEGIGPKIEELIKAQGIKTWAALANSTPEAIKEILTAAGSRYQAHDPTTWPDQARMAAEGRWDDLEKWQDELDGGKLT